MQYILVVALLFIGVVESIRRGKLSRAGAVAGGIIGFFVFVGAGFAGLAMLAAFFLLGTLATSWKRRQKKQVGMVQEPGGKRQLSQVLANGGVAGLLGVLAFFLPEAKNMAPLLIAGAFSSAIADTLSSELGTVYGTRFYNILTWRQDKKGLDGVVSLEGTAVGVVGSCLIALCYSAGFGWGPAFLWIVIAGTTGNLVDSYLGVTLERKKIIGNNTVNLLNTVCGALLLLFFV